MPEKYNPSDLPIEQILNFIKSEEIAIPEIQRPFVWKPTQVRDLIDSLYNGYPAGYLIISQSPNMKLKDGRVSEGKKIMIDGQQRVTAMMTALLGMEVLMTDFKKKVIKIAFNPQAEEDENCFEVQDNAILKDKTWIPDISVVFRTSFNSFDFVQNYCRANPRITTNNFNRKVQQLIDIKNRRIGVIMLDKELTVDEVTEIFIRINSQGTKLNQADFAMSKIAANEKYGGNMLRKAIDYFSHLAIQPDWYSDMCKDTAFIGTKYADKMKWLKDDRESIYDPNYSDMLRVSFMYKFTRGKMKDLVALLSGRDFEKKDYKEEIAEKSFGGLSDGVLDFMNEYHFKQFTLAIKDAGFISEKLINSDLTLDFAYTLYLLLLKDTAVDKTQIKQYVQRWYVLSTLTSRYITSPETYMDMDLRRIKEKGFVNYLEEMERVELSDSFWKDALIQNLETSAVNSPYISVFWAAQTRKADDALFTKDSKVVNLITTIGDVHHIFPKNYLQKNGITERSKYNQVANYTYLDTPTNIAVGETAPNVYFSKVYGQFGSQNSKIGNLKTEDEYNQNLAANCIPPEIRNMTYTQYDEFLQMRRKLMAEKIREYYAGL
jgi:hypothetical protein